MQRARIVLLAADGVAIVEIAQRVGVSRPTVNLWRGRYAISGVRGLRDAPRSVRPHTIDRRKVIAATLTKPPKQLGITHWSFRELARYLGIFSDAEVAAIWREAGVQPWRVETFKLSTDPQLEAKVIDVIGFYMNPP